MHRVRQLLEDLEAWNAIERLHPKVIEDGEELSLRQFCDDLADAPHRAKACLHGPEDYLLQLLVGDVARAAHPGHSLEDVRVEHHAKIAATTRNLFRDTRIEGALGIDPAPLLELGSFVTPVCAVLAWPFSAEGKAQEGSFGCCLGCLCSFTSTHISAKL
jgi:hypothetical protein